MSRIVTQLALAYPEVGFTLTSAARTVLQCPPAASLRDRLYQLYGERDDLIEVRKEAGGMRLTGFIAALAEQGPTRGPQNVFINRRIVKDRTIAHAIIDAYSVASIKERSPEVHLFIEMPPDARRRQRAPDEGGSAVSRAVAGARGGPARADGRARAERRAAAAAAARNRGASSPSRRRLPGVLAGGIYPESLDATSRRQPARAARQRVATGCRTRRHRSDAWRSARQPARARDSDIRPLIPLGQFRDTFIIAVDDEGIAIIDQHVAHERVLFERVMERLTAGPPRVAAAAGAAGPRPGAVGAPGAGRPRGRARAARLRARSVRRRRPSR